jgi:hypothetical protein
MRPDSVGPPDQQPIKRIIGRKERGIRETCTSLFMSEDRSAFSRQKTRSRIAPKGVFRYRSHAQANADMEKWVSESVGRFEIEKGQSTNFQNLVVDRDKDCE